jgi:hypothetical protein
MVEVSRAAAARLCGCGLERLLRQHAPEIYSSGDMPPPESARLGGTQSMSTPVLRSHSAHSKKPHALLRAETLDLRHECHCGSAVIAKRHCHQRTGIQNTSLSNAISALTVNRFESFTKL